MLQQNIKFAQLCIEHNGNAKESQVKSQETLHYTLILPPIFYH